MVPIPQSTHHLYFSSYTLLLKLILYSNISLKCRNVHSKSCICIDTSRAELFPRNTTMQLLQSLFFQNIIRNLSKWEKVIKQKKKRGLALVGSIEDAFIFYFFFYKKWWIDQCTNFQLLLFLMEHSYHVWRYISLIWHISKPSVWFKWSIFSGTWKHSFPCCS